MAPPLCDNQAEGRVTAREHSVGGTVLDACECAQDNAFAVA